MTGAPTRPVLSPGAVRLVVTVMCVGGIAGMIAGSIADNNGMAVTFGIVAAIASVCLIAVTAVTGGRSAGPTGGAVDEAQAALVESMIDALVAAGAPEDDLRALVRESVRLGRGR